MISAENAALQLL